MHFFFTFFLCIFWSILGRQLENHIYRFEFERGMIPTFRIRYRNQNRYGQRRNAEKRSRDIISRDVNK